ncbi:MAG: xylulokinase [Bryobacteraceae bacterium]|nr:xylulokinase [Bryobacteraceae bacterium]MDW8378268.1 xylulokinase [Bryobacterales bacterium]
MFWLGIDIGTGGSRAILVNQAGRLQAAYTSPHEEMRMPKPLWAEQRPENWWQAAQAAIRGVLAEAGVHGSQIRALGLSGQMHGLVLLDAQGEVIRPALIWCDQRSQAQVDAIHAKVGREKVLAYTANPVITGFTLPKLIWVRDHEPHLYARVRRVLLPKDFVRYKLTGEYASDVSDASGTSLFDVVGRRWSKAMCEAVEVPWEWLPQVYESPEVTGVVSAAAAEACGLKAGTPVVAGAGDQAASAVGNGIVQAGVVSCTLGTSGVVFASQQQPVYDPAGRVHTFCHAVPGTWHVMGVTQGAGLSLQWFRNQLAPGLDYDQLTAEAAQSPPGAQGLFWLPYLMGERTPHLDALARGAWVGLTAKHRRADLIRALLEGVSYSQKDCLEIIEAMGTPVEKIRLSGGGAKSSFWRQLLADVFGKPVVTLETQEGSAYGAALLALSREYGSVQETARLATREVDQSLPQEPATSFYRRAHPVYQSLYPALKPIYRQCQDL